MSYIKLYFNWLYTSNKKFKANKYKNGLRCSFSSENQTQPKKPLSKSISLFGRKSLDCMLRKRSDQKSPVGKLSSNPTKVFKLGFYTAFVLLCLTGFSYKTFTNDVLCCQKRFQKRKSPKIDLTDWNFLPLFKKLAVFPD